jgi:hypothetical protein
VKNKIQDQADSEVEASPGLWATFSYHQQRKEQDPGWGQSGEFSGTIENVKNKIQDLANLKVEGSPIPSTM